MRRKIYYSLRLQFILSLQIKQWKEKILNFTFFSFPFVSMGSKQSLIKAEENPLNKPKLIE